MFPFNKLKTQLNLLIHSHVSPSEVAGGFAIGIFVAATPTLGLHTIITIALAALFKKNEVAAILAVWIVNPLTMFPIFYFIFQVGHWIIGGPNINLKPDSIKDIFHLGGNLLIPLWVGGLVVGLASATLSFYIVGFIYPYLKTKFSKHG